MTLNPLKYLSPERIINLLKLITSYTVSVLLRRPVVFGMPLVFTIEPTNLCNLKCPECPTGNGELSRPAGMIKIEDFKKIIDEVAPYTFYVQLFLQGEPYINNLLPEMIEYAKSRKLYTVVSSNGHAINIKNIEKILLNAPDKLIISLDAIDEKEYQLYRIGGKFKDVNNNLKLLITKKREMGLTSPHIELQFIVMKQNEDHLNKFVEYGLTLGVNKVTLKTMQVYSIDSAAQYLPLNEKYRRYIIKDGILKIKSKLRNNCFTIWHTSVITWDGIVIPCCFDKDASIPLGNMKNSTFERIWKSDSYNRFRKIILYRRKEIEMCRNCTEGLNLGLRNV